MAYGVPGYNAWNSGGWNNRWSNNWYGGYSDANWNKLVNDPDQAAWQWSRSNGRGDTSRWANLAGQINAREMSRALGVGNTYSSNNEANLDAMGRVYNGWMGGRGGIDFSARNVINNLYNTNMRDANKVGTLANQFLTISPDSSPDELSSDLIRFLQNTVAPLVGGRTWNSYRRVLDDQSMRYQNYISGVGVNPGHDTSFLDWMKNSLGPGLGLFGR